MNERLRNQLILGGIVIMIFGSIFFLESQKAGPGAQEQGIGEIDVEKAIQKAQEDSGEDTVTETASESLNNDNRDLADLLTDTKQKEEAAKLLEARLSSKRGVYETAKEITSPDGFVNVEGFTIGNLIGKKVILVDFWTYSCINCQRTTPYLNSWHDKYKDDGLVIVGVHTPEFEFEKVYENVVRATEKFGIKYPVVLDNDYSTWTSYKNRYWPRKYLIDIDGYIVYDHIGEGAYNETEAKIVELLNERSQVLGERAVTMDTTAPKDIDVVDFSKVRSPETYLGSARSTFNANLPSLDCYGLPCDFELEDTTLLNTYQLGGQWIVHEEEAELLSDTGSIIIRFSASKVNLVAGGTLTKAVSAKIYLDGKLVDNSNKGTHVKADGSIEFSTDDLYNLIDLHGNYSEHELEIRFEESGVRAFAFTFG